MLWNCSAESVSFEDYTPDEQYCCEVKHHTEFRGEATDSRGAVSAAECCAYCMRTTNGKIHPSLLSNTRKSFVAPGGCRYFTFDIQRSTCLFYSKVEEWKETSSQRSSGRIKSTTTSEPTQ